MSIAPGEGKLPTNLLEEKDWDLKTFPGLHPDGENSLNSNRDKKLSEQDYFIQRILNKDTRFAKNPAYVFAASAYVEKKQIQRNTGVSYIRGKSNVEENGTKTFSLNDPYSVLDNIKNTPKYWQKARYELIARLENLGAFNFFFTLSCADMWWPENFVEVLKDKTVKYSSEPDEITVDGVLFDDYLKANADKHQFIKDNLLNATLTFHQRVKMFVKHIIMSKQNPMAIKHHSYKVEFAMRGAGHIHGVLWVDWENFSELPESDVENIKSALTKIREEKDIDQKEIESVEKFANLFVSCSLKNPLTEKIVREVNWHHHTKTCRKCTPACRFFFPRFPTLRTIVSVPIKNTKEKDPAKQKELLANSEIVKQKVKEILENEDQMKELEKIKSAEIEDWKHRNGLKEELQVYTKERLLALLKLAGVTGQDDEDMLQKYENALKVSSSGYRIFHERDIDEIYVNNYNPE